MHIDPIHTSAWNTSLHGTKYWIMLPNWYPKTIVNGRNARGDEYEKEEYSAIEYFTRLLPKIRESEGELPGIIECLQRPGETVFVPGGWWHAVLNLDDTMAVTQNFVNFSNLDRVWRSMRTQRPDLCQHFASGLKAEHPQAYKRVLELNIMDQSPLIEAHHRVPFAMDVSTDSNDSVSSDSHSHGGDDEGHSEASDEDVGNADNVWEDDDDQEKQDEEWASEDEEMESVLLLNREEILFKKLAYKKKMKKMQEEAEKNNKKTEEIPATS